MSKKIRIFSDGGALGNPGPGGWGAVVTDGQNVVELGDSVSHATNNQMELEAAIQGLTRVDTNDAQIELYTDSKYVIQGITQWVNSWVKNGWTTAQGKPVVNQDRWERLLKQKKRLKNLSWFHVPGHQGVPGNERVDQIANGFASQSSPMLYSGPLNGYGVDLDQVAVAQGAHDSGKKSAPGRKFRTPIYLSYVDGELKEHATWGECQNRVSGRQNAKYKKVKNEGEKKDILAKWGLKS